MSQLDWLIITKKSGWDQKVTKDREFDLLFIYLPLSVFYAPSLLCVNFLFFLTKRRERVGKKVAITYIFHSLPWFEEHIYVYIHIAVNKPIFNPMEYFLILSQNLILSLTRFISF
jgi:hypothetical protein